MGQQTRAQLVNQGLTVAGTSTAIAPLANVDLNARLRTTYASWPWPFLERKQEGFPLPAGTVSFLFGAGAANGPTLEVQKIIDPLFLYDATYSTRARVKIADWFDEKLELDETVNNPANTGLPTACKVLADTSLWGKWKIYLRPVPDKAYLLKLGYFVQPADIDISSAGDSIVPLYPNDKTLIQMVKCFGLEHMQRFDEYSAETQKLEQMLVNDRIRYGQVRGTNDRIGLDRNRFRPY